MCASKQQSAHNYETSKSFLPDDQPSHRAATATAHLHKVNAVGQTGDVRHHFFGALLPDRNVPAGKIVDADFHPCPFSFHHQAFYNELKKILRNGQKAKNPNVYTINSFKKMEI